MTTRERPSAWTVAAVIAAVMLAALGIGDRFWGPSSVTSYQVSQLTQAVRDLATKFDGLAKQTSVDALAARVDSQGNAIGVLQQGHAAMRADLDNLMRPPPFRNPKN